MRTPASLLAERDRRMLRVAVKRPAPDEADNFTRLGRLYVNPWRFAVPMKVFPSEKVLLSDLASRIAAYTGQPCPKNYPQLWRMCADGVLPSEKIGRCHWIDPRVAVEILGLKAA
jgi:hypothetical protein